MIARRLTAADKRAIVELYRQPGETALTIAERYGVSNTTIGRILKGEMAPQEYDRLVQQKRSRSTEVPAQGSLLEALPEPPIAEPKAQPEAKPQAEPDTAVEAEPPAVDRRIRRRVITQGTTASSGEVDRPIPRGVTPEVAPVPLTAGVDADMVSLVASELAGVAALPEDLEEEDDLDDLDDLDEDFGDDDEFGDEDGAMMPLPSLQVQNMVQIMPLSEADMPKVCYLVVDRAAELIVRPLRDFGELGDLTNENIQEMTLPVFDNHRVARRFSNIRTQRVIKVPDSRLFQKAALQLKAKGITRLLVDGQIYAL